MVDAKVTRPYFSGPRSRARSSRTAMVMPWLASRSATLQNNPCIACRAEAMAPLHHGRNGVAQTIAEAVPIEALPVVLVRLSCQAPLAALVRQDSADEAFSLFVRGLCR